MKKNNLEYIFKEGLQDFEANPPEHLWDNISKEIDPQKNRKKIFPLWYWSSGIAASILLFYIFIFNTSHSNDETKNIVTTNIIEHCPEENIIDPINLEEKALSNLSEIEKENIIDNANSIKNNIEPINFEEKALSNLSETEKENIIDSLSILNKESFNNLTKDEFTISKNTTVAFSKFEINKHEESKKAPISNNEPPDDDTFKEEDFNNLNQLSDVELASLILKGQNTKDTQKESIKKWSIQPQLGSYDYTSITGGSSINSNFNDNPQFIETDLSYGLRVSYQVSPKIKLRTGITYTSINITTSNIGIENTQNPQAVSELFTNNDIGFITLNNPGDFETPDVVFTDTEDVTSDEIDLNEPNNEVITEEEGITASPVDFNTEEEVTAPVITNEELIFDPFTPIEEEETPIESGSTTSGSISQNLQYLEFPIEVAYNLVDKKIGVDIIAGFSTFILTNNETTFQDTNNNSTFLGETTSLNNISFSGNVGFSVDYTIIKNLSFNIEPMIKFQFNSFDSSTDYQPILVGLSSGVIWKF